MTVVTTAAAPAGPIETDAVIIGAGPVGLFQVFELGLLEVKAHVIDALAHPGGQPVELYPDKPIFDIPGIPICTGRQLTESLLKQIEPFDATFHLGQLVTTLQKQEDGRFLVETSKGTQFLTKTVFIAAGVGAFQPRSLKIDGLDKYEGTQLFYRVQNPAELRGKRALIAGGDDAALEWALKLAQEGSNQAASVTLLHRRDRITAAPANLAKMAEFCEAKKMQFMVGQITGIEEQNGQLSGALVTGPDGITNSFPLDTLLIFLGLSPKLGPIADWSLAMERKQVVVDTEKFSTNVAGIFAVGDINTYPGKKKLILSGFHEATLAAFGAMPVIFPEKKIFLQYTTASPRLHALLRVGSPPSE